ncbi:unnamed protein product [Lepeophtheirus salmonis]|uniref:(salmon louse) hypothetical protein n=1 Tax=Lepeophtheirus salmonis TaxID=72036 RepID=A0A7R8D1A4_LEPSM|nr:unnamed protein product [Lepeophtheirus salmonis]CAF2993243.1 unnamed protein product [Lepeophtheirus salmonis]
MSARTSYIIPLLICFFPPTLSSCFSCVVSVNPLRRKRMRRGSIRLSIYSSSSTSSSSDFGFKSGSIKTGRAYERHPGAKKLLKQKSSDCVGIPKAIYDSTPLPPNQPPAYSSQGSTPQHKDQCWIL